MSRVRQAEAMPTSAVIVEETFQRLGYVPGAMPAAEVLQRFNDLLRNLWEETLFTLEAYEEKSYSEGIPREFITEFPEAFNMAQQVSAQRGLREAVIGLFSEWYPMLRRAFLSVQQGRMTRGGRDFELQIEGLLDLAEIPYHKQERQYRTDLILPDLATHTQNRTISAVISIKRTLRERWAEVAEELFNLRSPNVFLFTADDNVSNTHIDRVCRQYNIYLILWDSVKNTRFPDEPLVLGYTEWATRRLAILREHWN